MKVFFLVFVCFIALSFGAEFRKINNDKAIENQFIVVFKNITKEQRDQHLQNLFLSFLNDQFPNKFLHSYEIGDFTGFSAILSPKLLKAQLYSQNIDYIEQDAIIKKFDSCNVQGNAVWGLDRIAEEDVDLDGTYIYPEEESSVDAYIVDTGIQINHVEFQGRAVWGANFIDDIDTDCNGHGTHVAGTIGSATYGVSKKTTLIAVKVLDCNGSGSYAAVVAGVNWVTSSSSKRGTSSVANMSLGGPPSSALNAAVQAAIASGVSFVVAAGNSNDDACDYSPASVPSAVSVGATGIDDDEGTEEDNRAYFSNYGTCVTLFAPGLLIQSTWIGSKNTELQTISGTSMASPHVAGVVALYLSQNPGASPATVKSWLLRNSGSNLIDLECVGALDSSVCSKSPNKLLHSPCA